MTEVPTNDVILTRAAPVGPTVELLVADVDGVFVFITDDVFVEETETETEMDCEGELATDGVFVDVID